MLTGMLHHGGIAKSACHVVALLCAAAALVILPATTASAAPCTPGVSTSPDGTVHEGGTCVTNPTPDPTNPTPTVPVPEWPKTVVIPACSGAFTLPPGVQLDTTAYCPQPPCPDGTWDRFARFVQPAAGAVAGFQGTFCADPEAPPVPVITPQMVTDAAKQVAPKPTANVQPGTRSYANIPNNYFTEHAESTVPVTVLGQQIQVTFVPVGDTWDFGDGATADGSGIEDADVGAPGAVEHAYDRTGSYGISVSRTFTVRFTIPGAPVTVENAFTIPGPETVLPVGEIQTRVDNTH